MNSRLDREIKKIKKYFDFLFIDGYAIIHSEPATSFNNWLVDLRSNKGRIQFCEDRGDLIVKVGPREATTGWSGAPLYEIEIIIFYLSHEQKVLGWRKTTRDGFEKTSTALQSYKAAIEKFFAPENYREHDQALRLAITDSSRRLNKELVGSLSVKPKK